MLSAKEARGFLKTRDMHWLLSGQQGLLDSNPATVLLPACYKENLGNSHSAGELLEKAVTR